MKLLITLDFPPEKGGIQKYLLGIVLNTYKKEDYVLVGCRSSQKYKEKIYSSLDYISNPLSKINKKFSLIPLFIKLLKIYLKNKDNLFIECGNIYTAIIPYIISLFLPVKYAVYCYGTELYNLRKYSLKKIIFTCILKKANVLFAISQYTKSLISQLIQNNKEKIKVIYPKLIITEQKKLELIRTLNNKQEKVDNEQVINMLSVGRLVWHKGHIILLRAVLLLPANIKWHLVICGNGPLLKYLVDYCKEKNIKDLVEIKTSLSDDELELEYKKASFFIFPSIYCKNGVEGFGIALLEAMANNLPIIATNAGGIPEVLDNGNCGILVPSNNPQAIKDAIIKLSEDKELKQKLIKNAIERLLKYFVW
jgi:phosphatidylinositol alpha-1,6-mannosyltransferase